MLKFTELEKKILTHIEFKPYLTAAQLSKLVKSKTTKISYTIRRLEERGIIWKRAFIDPMRLGLQDIGLFFNISGASPKIRKAIEQRFLESPEVGWLGILAGEFQYGAIYLCRHLAELGNFLKGLSTDFGVSLGDRVITPRITYSRYSRRYLVGSLGKPKKLGYKYETPAVILDELDTKILRQLDSSNFESFRKIAQILSVPQTTLDRRVKNLVQSGVIRGFMYEIDISKLSITMSRILIQTRGARTEIDRVFQLFCERCSNITYVVEAMGTWDIEVGFETFSSEEDVAVLNLFYEICGPVVGSSRVMRELKDLKFSYMPL